MIQSFQRKVLFFSLFFIFSANTAFANLRAPWAISRYPSFALAKTANYLTVIKEDLEFNCDEAYEGEGDLSRIKERKCLVIATYYIQSDRESMNTLEFVLPSEKSVFISINTTNSVHNNSKLLKLSDLEKEGYRLSDLCVYCSETINQLFSVQFNAKFLNGENTIKVEYEQPLAITEIRHGYYKSSKWMNGFSYELWPLKEWRLSQNFEINIKFKTKVGGVISRIFGQKLTAGCRGIDLRFTKVPGLPFQKNIGRNGFDDYYRFNQNNNPNFNFEKSSKTHYEGENLIYQIKLNHNFTDRINCFYGHAK